jgi:hypothetical protein
MCLLLPMLLPARLVDGALPLPECCDMVSEDGQLCMMRHHDVRPRLGNGNGERAGFTDSVAIDCNLSQY